MKPLVGQSPHHLKTHTTLSNKSQNKKLEPGEGMTSFDVKAPFTSVPVDPSIQIVKQRLSQNNTLHQRTNMSIPQIVTLLEFCHKTPTSSSRAHIMNRFMVQPWVPPSVPSLPTCSWRSLKSRPLAPFHIHRLWLWFVDDTFVIIKAEHSKQLLCHINSQDPCIHFTVEEPSQQGSLPFLDTLLTMGPHHKFHTTVYRKLLHTDQYLHWDSNHFITAKQSIYNTLMHRAKIVSHNQEELNKELEHIKKVLQACQFPPWALKQLQHKFNKKKKQP